MMMETNFRLGRDCVVQDNVVIGLVYGEGCGPAVIGDDAVIRSNTVIYGDVKVGNKFRTGHGVMIREGTVIGDCVLVGSQTVIDGRTRIGDNVSIQTGVYIPLNSVVGSNVFIGPRAVLTNDKYPVRKRVDLVGPVLRDNVSVGANSIILPGVTLGEGSFVAAGAIVTRDVPPWSLAIGSPAEFISLPEDLRGRNMLE